MDSVREIRDNIRYAAAAGKYRIYIIDEVHMLSPQAFNALLKTLEEPPPHSLFIFATTDAQKIPVTVLSRVQRFDLKRLGSREMLDRLHQIASAEGISIPESVMRALVRESDGSLRDAETLLDRLVSAFGNAIEEEGAREILDLIEHKIVTDIVDPVLGHDASAALAAVRHAIDAGVDGVRLAAAILQELRDLLVARLVEDLAPLVDAAPAEVAELQRRAKPHDPETLQRLFRVLLTRNQELGLAPRPEQALEMAVVRLATLPEAEALSSLIERLDAFEAGPATGGGSPVGSGPSRGGPERGSRGPPRRSQASAAPAPAPTPGPTASEREARLRREAKEHPVVQEVISALDAELQEVRVPRPRGGELT